MLPRALRVATESERGRQQTCEFANERDEARSESERYGGDREEEAFKWLDGLMGQIDF